MIVGHFTACILSRLQVPRVQLSKTRHDSRVPRCQSLQSHLVAPLSQLLCIDEQRRRLLITHSRWCSLVACNYEVTNWRCKKSLTTRRG